MTLDDVSSLRLYIMLINKTFFHKAFMIYWPEVSAENGLLHRSLTHRWEQMQPQDKLTEGVDLVDRVKVKFVEFLEHGHRFNAERL